MTRLVLLLTTLAFSVLFMFVQPDGEIGFLFSDIVLPADLWFYYFMEHFIRVILVFVIFDMATEYKTAFTIFFIIQMIELLDYVLTYGEPWFDSKVFTWNTIKVGLFSLSILYEKYGR